MSSTSESSPATSTSGRFRPRDWAAVSALVAALIVGFAAGRLAHGNDDPQPDTMRSGVVDSIDSGGSVCVSFADGVSCYQAPGLGLTEGQQIRFKVEAQSLDPDDLTKGTQDAIVWLERE
jgi:hypothetical protein